MKRGTKSSALGETLGGVRRLGCPAKRITNDKLMTKPWGGLIVQQSRPAKIPIRAISMDHVLQSAISSSPYVICHALRRSCASLGATQYFCGSSTLGETLGG